MVKTSRKTYSRVKKVHDFKCSECGKKMKEGFDDSKGGLKLICKSCLKKLGDGVEARATTELSKNKEGVEFGQKINISINNDFRSTEFDESDLLPKQLLFVEEFMVDLNGTQAAIRAGYPEKTARQAACENLTKPNIQLAIRRRLRYRLANVRIQQQWVLDELVNQYYEASQAVPVLDMWGRPTGLWKSDRKNAIKCLELIGRHLGMFGDEELNPKERGQVLIIQLPDNGRNSPNQTTRRIPNEDAQLSS